MLEWLFGKKQSQPSIRDLTLNQLQEEKVRLEVEERKGNKAIMRLEEEKTQLFKQGTAETSKREKLVYARKIKELDEEVKGLDRKASIISQQIRVVNRLTAVKRKEHELREAGLWSTIVNMDPLDLDRFLNEGVLRDETMASKVQSILGVLEAESGMGDALKEDPEILKLVALMEEAGESGQVEKKYAELDEILKKDEMERE